MTVDSTLNVYTNYIGLPLDNYSCRSSQSNVLVRSDGCDGELRIR